MLVRVLGPAHVPAHLHPYHGQNIHDFARPQKKIKKMGFAETLAKKKYAVP
jgi:hypothetical protein